MKLYITDRVRLKTLGVASFYIMPMSLLHRDMNMSLNTGSVKDQLNESDTVSLSTRGLANSVLLVDAIMIIGDNG